MNRRGRMTGLLRHLGSCAARTGVRPSTFRRRFEPALHLFFIRDYH